MLSMMRNTKYAKQAGFVLQDCSPEEVARSVIGGKHQKEPFYIFDMDEAYRRIQCFRTNMPRIQMFYAMKANDCEMMLKLAVAMGIGFDCSSPEEISKIMALNVHPSSVIYAVPMKTPEQMMYARKCGVRHTNFDSSCELKKLKQYWPDARLLLRIRVDSDSVYKLGEKCGCDFETEATQLLDEAANMGLRVIGVAFHVGSACYSSESYSVGLRNAKALFDYEASFGRKMEILDIGGGFFHDNNTDRFDHVSTIINRELDELFPETSVQVIAEPGRYLCESAFTLYCNIINVRQEVRDNTRINMLYINDGVYGTLGSFEKWHTVHKFQDTSVTEKKLTNTLLWGPTCDSKDRLPEEVQLPSCSPDDWLVFRLQGSYSFVASTKFSVLGSVYIHPVVSSDLWYKLKLCSVFKTTDFKMRPDVCSPLSSTMPPVLPHNNVHDNETIFIE